ncbi:hypothetical protein BvCmsKKP061_02227 [Escherichia coli]|uniref:Uncharacterized protein n=1 Tax=Escherichia coli TaxID=562 RepID=A0A4D0S301_ECOLX|nr:hypothetical protein BvCmsKKP061_02227 [Escherichia coli]GDL82007.1 hypothetical protein BvCmsKSP045_05289 [Escherichia coli]
MLSSVRGVWRFIHSICSGSSPLMKYSVWLKGTYCSGFITSPWRAKIRPSLSRISAASLTDGSNSRLLYFSVLPIPGTAGGRRLLRITRALKASIFRPISPDCSSAVRRCMITVSMSGSFTGHRSPQVPRSAAATLCPHISRAINPRHLMVPPSFAGQYPAGFPG